MSDTHPERVQVPASLDLVERARLGINGLMGTLDPDVDFEPYFLTFFAARPAYFVHWSSLVSGVLPKYAGAMALLRCMSGSDDQRDVEQGMLASVLNNCAEDGLIYDRVDARRPWNVGVGYGRKSWNEDYSCLAGDGELVCALDWHYQLSGDDEWRRRMKRAAERMLELAVVKNDFAYYPNVGCGNDFSYPRKSGWVHTDEPQGPQEGGEGATTFYLALPLRGLVRWYRHSGDECMIDMCRKMAAFITLPKFWGGAVELEPSYGPARAHWWGHVHGTLKALRGLLEYAIVADDYRVKRFVRDGYEWGRHNIEPRLGLDNGLEGCATADLVALGIQLSDAGIGDYWDDVDAVVRNSLCEAQVTDIDALRHIGEVSPERPHGAAWGAAYDWRFGSGILYAPLPGQECTEHVLERSIGAFACNLIGGRYQSPFQMHCCTANGNQAFYYAWEAVARGQGEDAVVNLWFNRFSPWVDVESYLPYEGKLVLRAKLARRLSVRVPAWVRRSQLVCKVNEHVVTPSWAGAYLLLRDLPAGAVVTLAFPLERETVTLPIPSMNSRQYRGVAQVTATFKGSTCIGLAEPEEEVHGMQPAWVPMFRRPEFQQDQAPMREVEYRVVEQPIRWY
jgi:hypothetical protein